MRVIDGPLLIHKSQEFLPTVPPLSHATIEVIYFGILPTKIKLSNDLRHVATVSVLR